MKCGPAQFDELSALYQQMIDQMQGLINDLTETAASYEDFTKVRAAMERSLQSLIAISL